MKAIGHAVERDKRRFNQMGIFRGGLRDSVQETIDFINDTGLDLPLNDILDDLFNLRRKASVSVEEKAKFHGGKKRV